jgi:predicted component of type VI protein secretion system
VEPKTAVTVTSANPPTQLDPEKPYETVVGDMSGYVEPPAEDDDAQEPVSRLKSVEVRPDNFDDVRRGVWKPRFKGAVPDVVTGSPDRTIEVDVALTSRVQNWAGDLDRGVPQLAAINKLVRDVERLQSQLSRQPALRDRVEALMHAVVAPADDAPKAGKKK